MLSPLVPFSEKRPPPPNRKPKNSLGKTKGWAGALEKLRRGNENKAT